MNYELLVWMDWWYETMPVYVAIVMYHIMATMFIIFYIRNLDSQYTIIEISQIEKIKGGFMTHNLNDRAREREREREWERENEAMIEMWYKMIT